MSYAKSVLQPGETVVIRGRLHWIGYWPAALLLVLGIAFVSWLYAYRITDVLIWAVALIFGALFIFFLVRAWFERWITEFAVTDKRVIYKRGFIYRRTAEMNMDKVESVDVDQSIPGRLLDYGTIQVVGTGGVHVVGTGGENNVVKSGITVHRIASPFQLRNAITAK